jgi:hypothetical protein
MILGKAHLLPSLFSNVSLIVMKNRMGGLDINWKGMSVIGQMSHPKMKQAPFHQKTHQLNKRQINRFGGRSKI